ncbi:hypothetical protein YUWDRAFT_06379 [Streptomyces sp. AmelKG-D3]|nr:hypothetical protein YUWDRAFT_06379 [Streptomyces sp. AmelKG-D3]
MGRTDQCGLARRRSRPGCPCLREARPEDTQKPRPHPNRTGPTPPATPATASHPPLPASGFRLPARPSAYRSPASATAAGPPLTGYRHGASGLQLPATAFRHQTSGRRTPAYRFSAPTGTACRNRAHRGHRSNRPGPIRPAPSCCIGNDEVAKTCPSAQRTTVRSIDSIKSLPQPHMDEKATLGDEQDATTSGTPTAHATPPTPATPNHVHRPHSTTGTTQGPCGSYAEGLTWGRVLNGAAPMIIGNASRV